MPMQHPQLLFSAVKSETHFKRKPVSNLCRQSKPSCVFPVSSFGVARAVVAFDEKRGFSRETPSETLLAFAGNSRGARTARSEAPTPRPSRVMADVEPAVAEAPPPVGSLVRVRPSTARVPSPAMSPLLVSTKPDL
jgi:hypothetical protein